MLGWLKRLRHPSPAAVTATGAVDPTTAMDVRPSRPYLFYGTTRALCATCLRTVDAKEVIEDGQVFLLKHCPEHGAQRVLIAEDADFWRLGRERFLKPPSQVRQPNTTLRVGCPHDCGICPEHEQHGCVSLLEITDVCNLRCPTCYAASGAERQHRPLEQIERMLDAIVANEGEPDVLQVTGGEPTTHPELFAILDACRRRPIHHLMLATNGIRVAEEAGFAERLAGYMPRFELYLQFDSLRPAAQLALRGRDLTAIRARAMERLNALGISTSLVVTVRRGVNDQELGALIEYAAAQPCVRGVVFQPECDVGRAGGFVADEHRLTLSGLRRRILAQTRWFAPEDIIPVPCNPAALAMAFALKRPGGITPLTHLIDPQVLIALGGNTIVYEDDQRLRQAFLQAFSTGHGPASAARALDRLVCCVPRLPRPDIRYDRVFRVTLLEFRDRHNLDLRSVRMSCIHIAHPDGRRVIPFDTYNLLHRATVTV